jgi:hypothetical protein
VTGRKTDFHVQLLKPFICDEGVRVPLEVPIKEHDEYLVEQIMNHRYTVRVNGRPRGLECLVRWVGYQEQSWEPSFKKLKQFHTYARRNGLIRFIPTAYRGKIRREVPQEE